jgi:uncharacterized protein with HEPN domain
MRKADEIRLRHMLDAAEEAVGFCAGVSREDLTRQRMLALAVVKDLEIIGEAAAKVSADVQQGLSSIPWTDVVGMRNRLIHAYFEIDLDVVWQTVSTDLPQLIEALRTGLSGSKP